MVQRCLTMASLELGCELRRHRPIDRASGGRDDDRPRPTPQDPAAASRRDLPAGARSGRRRAAVPGLLLGVRDDRAAAGARRAGGSEADAGRAACRWRAPTTRSRCRSTRTTSRSPPGSSPRRDRSSSTTGSPTSTTDVVKAFEKKYGSRSRSARSPRSTRRSRSSRAAPSSSTCSCPSPCSSSGSPSARSCSRSTKLHPEPQAQRLAVARQPVVRRRQPLHGSVHDLHDRHRLARGQAAGLRSGEAGQPVVRAVGGGADDRRQGGTARRSARGLAHGPAPQRRHRRQHREAAQLTAAQKALIS